MDSVKTDTTRRFWRNLAVQFVLGAIAGAAAVIVLERWVSQADFGDANEAGLLIGALLLYLGAVIAFASAKPARAAKMMGQSLEPGEDFSAETSSLRLQAVVTILAGVELMLLSWRTDMLTGPARDLLVAGLAMLVAVQTWLNYRLWRHGDEFFRRLIVDTSVITFVVMQFLLFACAVGTRFGLMDEPSVLEIYVTLMAVYLVAGFFAGTRRGLGVPAR